MAAAVLVNDDTNIFAPSPLRRSKSQSSLRSRRNGFRSSASTSNLTDMYGLYAQSTANLPDTDRAADRCAPQLPPIPDRDAQLHNAQFEQRTDEEDILLPQYDVSSSNGTTSPPSDTETLSTLGTSVSEEDTLSPDEEQSDTAASDTTSRPPSPPPREPSKDDTAVGIYPSRHVDYLSHDWREEELWSSWRYITARRCEYTSSARLENAAWRNWTRLKYGLSTIPPENLNWFKDCDVTWLYGPLQTAQYASSMISHGSSFHSSALSSSNSFVKKPILKKRSMSEIILRRSLSSSSLVMQAATAAQAQQDQGERSVACRPGLWRSTTDIRAWTLTSEDSLTSSGLTTPSSDRKHIHFNEQVEQCIAVDVKGADDDDAEPVSSAWYDSESDRDFVMMKRVKRKRKQTPRKGKTAWVTQGKTIAKLPSTTLKYQEDADESADTASPAPCADTHRGHILSPSSSQETLRPSKPGRKFFFSDDDEDCEGYRDAGADGSCSSDLGESSSLGLYRSASAPSLISVPHDNIDFQGASSDRFHRNEHAEENDEQIESSYNDGILGRIVDTVNTARDIAHVIWNVGWRK